MQEQQKVIEFLKCVGILAIQNFLLPSFVDFSIELGVAFRDIFFATHIGERNDLCDTARQLSKAQTAEITNQVYHDLQLHWSSFYRQTPPENFKGISDQLLKTLSSIEDRDDPRSIHSSISFHIIPDEALQSFQERLQLAPKDTNRLALCSSWKNAIEKGNILAGALDRDFPVLPGFDIQCQVGRGSFARVFRAQDSQGKYCALKIGSLANKVQFEREVQVLKTARHPRLVEYHASGSFRENGDECYWIAMEYVSPYTLRNVLSRPLAPYHALWIIRQIFEALAFLHDRAIIHRDLKPANILIDTMTFEIKLSDFGLAKAIGEKDVISVSASGLTGTPLYMSPEQVTGGKISTTTDIWSAGIILVEMLSGQNPFAGQNIMALGNSILTQDIDLQMVPGPLRNFCGKLLARKVSDRIENGQQALQFFHRQLQPFIDECLRWQSIARWETIIANQLLQSFSSQYAGQWQEAYIDKFGDFCRDHAIVPAERSAIAKLLPKIFAIQNEIYNIERTIADKKSKMDGGFGKLTGRQIALDGQTIVQLENDLDKLRHKQHREIRAWFCRYIGQKSIRKRLLSLIPAMVAFGLLWLGYELCSTTELMMLFILLAPPLGIISWLQTTKLTESFFH